MNNLIRRTIHPEVRLLDEKQGLVEYVASTETLDSYSEIIRADGWKFDDFQKNAPFVDSHNYNSIDCILGRVVDFTVRNKRLVETVKWAIDVPENVTAQKGFAMTAAGYLKAVSVGFMPVNYVTPFDRNLDDWRKVCEEMELDPEDTRCRCIYVEQQQKELSACVIGANADAVAIEKSYEAGILSDSDVALFSKRSTSFAQLFEQRNRSSRSYSFAPSPKPNAVEEAIKALGGKPSAPPASEPKPTTMKKDESLRKFDSLLLTSKSALDGMETARRDGNLIEIENAVRRAFESHAREKRSSFGDPIERYLNADLERRYFWNGFARKLVGGLKIGSPEYRAVQNMQQKAVSGIETQDTLGAGLLLAVPVANELYDLMLHYGAYKYLGLRKMVGAYTLYPKVTANPQAIFITPTQQGKTTIPYDASYAGAGLGPLANTIATIIQASRAWVEDQRVDLSNIILNHVVRGFAQRIDWGAFQGNGNDDQTNGMTKGIFFDPAIASLVAPSGSNAVGGLNRQDFLSAVGNVSAAALQRMDEQPPRWYINPTLIPQFLQLRDGAAPNYLLKTPAETGGEWLLVGFPVTWAAQAPNATAPGSKILAFGNPDAYLVALHEQFEIMMTQKGSEFPGATAAFRAIGRGFSELREVTGFTTLALG